MVKPIVHLQPVVILRRKVAAFFTNRRNQQHIRGGTVQVEILPDVVFQYRRGERAEPLAVLDLPDRIRFRDTPLSWSPGLE
jgi:hypothetical protein